MAKAKRRSRSKPKAQGSMLLWCCAATVAVAGIFGYEHRRELPLLAAATHTPQAAHVSREPPLPVTRPVLTAAIAPNHSASALPVPPKAIPVAMPVERAQSIAPAANGGRYGLCANGVSANCVVDGGTFLQDGVKIRLADIEAPDPRAAHCADEERKATAATLRLQTLLNAGTFAVSASGRDQDEAGRKLRIVMRAGRSVGDQLVAEGLAHRWNGRAQAWCGS